jgi:hypothetical protein
MKTFNVEYELPNKRAIVKGAYSELCIDDKIILVDSAEIEYNAVVETRIGGGAVVRVTGFR